MVRFSLLVCLLAATTLGCGSAVTEFPSDRVLALRMERAVGEPQDAAVGDAALVLEALFGTPDIPHVPAVIAADPELAGLLDADRLRRAAGPVSSDREGVDYGLYRKHCVECHGLAGDGAGPTAGFQNPYPRDYRLGVFKWKSTPRGAKPTRGDLRRVLHRGVPGTAMPQFAPEAFADADLEALVDYVIYLAIRGEVEQRLLREAAIELGYGPGTPPAADRLIAPELRQRAPGAYREQLGWIRAQVVDVARRWASAEQRIEPVPPPPEGLVAQLAGADAADAAQAEAIERGRKLFHGQTANCAACHGEDGSGDNPPRDYDDWTRQWTIAAGIDPENREAIRPFLDAGALRPRIAWPRDLRLGVFRGGDAPEDIYRRILHGIDGTPMPGVNRLDAPGPTGLTDDEIWDLVSYVTALGREAGS